MRKANLIRSSGKAYPSSTKYVTPCWYPCVTVVPNSTTSSIRRIPQTSREGRLQIPLGFDAGDLWHRHLYSVQGHCCDWSLITALEFAEEDCSNGKDDNYQNSTDTSSDCSDCTCSKTTCRLCRYGHRRLGLEFGLLEFYLRGVRLNSGDCYRGKRGNCIYRYARWTCVHCYRCELCCGRGSCNSYIALVSDYTNNSALPLNITHPKMVPVV